MKLTGTQMKEYQEAGFLFEKTIPAGGKPYWHVVDNEGKRTLIHPESEHIINESIWLGFLVMDSDRRFGSWSVQTWVGK